MDGVGVVLAVREWDRKNGIENREILYAQYGKDKNKVLDGITSDCNLIIGDFSFEYSTMEMLDALVDGTFVCIDHHASAQKELSGLDYCIFDMSKSGAVLTWEYLFPDVLVPKLLKYIQDRDIWTWKLPNSHAVSAALQLIPITHYDVFEEHMYDIDSLMLSGIVVLNYQELQVEKVMSRRKDMPTMVIGGHKVPCINTTALISEIGNAIAGTAKFAALYFDTATERVFSLRSVGDFDVSQIARKYGGGGHRNAAGFSVPLPEFKL